MRILLVEDNERIVTLLKRGLQAQRYEVENTDNGITAMELIFQQSFDMIITDIILPEMNGIELCKEVKRLMPQMPIIMLTALGTTDEKIEGFDAGADDYMVKPFELRELYARIKAVANRIPKDQAQLVNQCFEYHDLKIDWHKKLVHRAEVEISLTPKEFKLLSYFANHRERVIGRSELAENVWDNHFDTGTNFIDVYINYLRKKIDRNFELKLIHTRSGMGFIFSAEP